MAISLLALGISTLTGAGIYLAKDAWENRDITKLKKEWDKILEECTSKGIKNNSGQTFLLMNIKRMANGYKCKTVIPSGLSFGALEGIRDVLESKLNALITIKKDRYCKFVNIEIVNKRPKFNFRLIKTTEDKPFLGFLANGKPYFVDLNYEPHVVWTGKSRSGKSTACFMTLANHIAMCKQFDLYIAQVVNGETDIFADAKQVKMISKTYEETQVMLKKLLSIIEKRTKIISESKSMNIKHYNKKFPNKKLKRVILLMEEFSFFALSESDTDEIKTLKQKCEEIFLRIAKAGAYAGVHLFGIVQRMTSTSINTTIRGQVSVLSFVQKDNRDSGYAINTPDAANLQPRECIFSGSGSYEFLSAPKTDEELSNLKKLVPVLRIETAEELKNNKKEGCLNNNTLQPLKNTDPFEETNRWRVPKDEQTWPKENTSKIIDISQKSKSDISGEDEEVATGSVVDISTQGKYDKAILNFIDNYGCITIKQCTQMFYKNRNESQRRLKQLEEKGILKSYLNKRIREKVYYIKEEISSHDILRADFISKLTEEGATILKYETPHLLNDLLRPDAILKIKYQGNEYNIILEVDYTHFTNQDKLILYDKYAKEYNKNFILAIMRENSINEKVKLNWYKLKHVQFALKCQLINLLIS